MCLKSKKIKGDRKNMCDKCLLENVESACNSEDTDKKVTITADQEDWLQARLLTLVRTTFDIERNKRVCADESITDSAIYGAVLGTAREIVLLLGLKQPYVNIPRSIYRS